MGRHPEGGTTEGSREVSGHTRSFTSFRMTVLLSNLFNSSYWPISSFIATTLSAQWSKSCSWVIIRIVTPVSFCSFLMSCMMFSLLPWSRFPVGSSVRRIGVWYINALAIATLCCSHQLSWSGYTSIFWLIQTNDSISCVVYLRSRFERSPGSSRFSLTVSWETKWNFWNTNQIVDALYFVDPAFDNVSIRFPSTITSPVSIVSKPAMMLNSVVFQDPLDPVSITNVHDSILSERLLYRLIVSPHCLNDFDIFFSSIMVNFCIKNV